MSFPDFAGDVEWRETPEGFFAKGRLAKDAEFFKDHFPRFPVLPGVLMLEILKRTAEVSLAAKNKNQDSKWRLTRLSGVRFSAYVKPGDEWEARLAWAGTEEGRQRWKGSLSSGGHVAAQAQFILEPAGVFFNTAS